MKHYQFLAICTTALLLSACGGGSGGSGGNFTTPNSSSSLGQNYTVPNHLKDAVREALSMLVDWDPAPGPGGYKPLTIAGKTYNKGDRVYFTDFDLGYSEKPYLGTYITKAKQSGIIRVYRLPYSMILSHTISKAEETLDDDSVIRHSYGTGVNLSSLGYLGYHTKEEDLPQTGKATYVGKSFYHKETGNFNLDVDFGSKKVNGEITGLTTGLVTLEEADIKPVGFQHEMGFEGNVTIAKGKALQPVVSVDRTGNQVFYTEEYNTSKYDFEYEGHFFGPKAEEVAGIIVGHEKLDHLKRPSVAPINFAGQRGEIK